MGYICMCVCYVYIDGLYIADTVNDRFEIELD